MKFTLQIASRQGGQRTFIICKIPASKQKRSGSTAQEELLDFFSSCLVLQSKPMQKDVRLFPAPAGDIFIVVNPPTDAGIVLKVFEEQARGKEFEFTRSLLNDEDYDSLAVLANQLQMRIKINWSKFKFWSKR